MSLAPPPAPRGDYHGNFASSEYFHAIRVAIFRGKTSTRALMPRVARGGPDRPDIKDGEAAGRGGLRPSARCRGSQGSAVLPGSVRPPPAQRPAPWGRCPWDVFSPGGNKACCATNAVKLAAAAAAGDRFSQAGGAARAAVRPCGARADGARGFNVETSHNVETPHRTETFQLHSMFYFRATKSFHVIRRPGAGSRAVPVAWLPAAPRSPRLSRHRADGPARRMRDDPRC
jgi:hypothetical protein